MDFSSIASAQGGSALSERTVPYDVILSTLPDDITGPVIEMLALAVDVVPLPADPRATYRAIARQQVEAVLSGKAFDPVKVSAKALAEFDAQTLAHYVSRAARTEIGQHAAGAMMRALPAAFAWWSERLAVLQSEHADLVDEHGLLLCSDELNARRRDALEVFTAALSLRAEHDAIREAHRAARTITDSDARARYRPEASFRHSDGRVVLTSDVTSAVESVFASTDPMSAASSMGWVLWAPSPSDQQAAVDKRLRQAA